MPYEIGNTCLVGPCRWHVLVCPSALCHWCYTVPS